MVLRAAMKPITTLARPLASVDLHTGETTKTHYERSDVRVVRAGVIAEARLADSCLEKFGDSLKENPSRLLQLSKQHVAIGRLLTKRGRAASARADSWLKTDQRG